jgi:beta-lactamase class A
MANKGKNLKLIVIIPTLLLLGFAVGFAISNSIISCDTEAYRYINKELVCKDELTVKKNSYVEMKSELEKYIVEKKKDNSVTEVAIYFRDLQNGPTFGINEYERFSPASLLKLPLFLTYLNLSIDNPMLLGTEIAFEENIEDIEQYFKPTKTAQPNTGYTIDELLGYMIKYSDNHSYYALRQYLNQVSPNVDVLQETFIDLGIIDPKGFTDQTLSVKSYASIFVQLYHNSFFSNKELSEKALEFLTGSDFYKGISLGVPVDIKVANKFGERFLPNNQKQLHDCGVVYYPENPYMICIMTRGHDFEKLSKTIGEISKSVYDEFNSRKL